MSIVHIVDGWLSLVSLSVDGVLFKLEVRSVAVEWQLWAALMVDGWLLVVSLSVNGVLFMLVDFSVAGGWQLWVALMGDDMSFGVELVGALLGFDVLFVLVVVMDGACMLLV